MGFYIASAVANVGHQKGEIFKETKDRLSKRTGIKGKQFEKIKFAVVPRVMYSNPRYLEDGKHVPVVPEREPVPNRLS